MSEVTALRNKARSWEERIKAQIRSGQSVREFCEDHRLNRHTFSYWKRKLKPSRFIPISGAVQAAAKSSRVHLPGFAGSASDSSVGIRLPNGVEIELGAGLESVAVHQLIQELCGVNHEKS